MSVDIFQVESLIVPQPKRHKLKTNEYKNSGSVPIVDQGSDFIAGYTDDFYRIYDGNLPIIVFGDHTCCLKYIDFPFAIGADGTQILRPVDGIDTRYLYYALHTADLEQFGYQRHFKLLKDCRVRVPNLDTQRRIASILGAYDDLIKVNRRRAAVLEEMARGLFEQHSKKVEATELLFNIASVSYGKNLPKSHLSDDAPYPVFGASKVIGRYTRFTHSERTIIVGCRGTVGQFQISLPNSFITNNSFSIEPHRQNDFAWVYFALRKRGLADTISGSAQPQITLEGASRVEIVFAEQSVRDAFSRAAMPLLQLGWISSDTITRLASCRDLLLPRLISGQLTVEAAERQLEEAA